MDLFFAIYLYFAGLGSGNFGYLPLDSPLAPPPPPSVQRVNGLPVSSCPEVPYAP